MDTSLSTTLSKLSINLIVKNEIDYFSFSFFCCFMCSVFVCVMCGRVILVLPKCFTRLPDHQSICSHHRLLQYWLHLHQLQQRNPSPLYRVNPVDLNWKRNWTSPTRSCWTRSCFTRRSQSSNAAADVNLLQELMTKVEPVLLPQQVQNHIRWSALTAHDIISKYPKEYTNLMQAFREKRSLEDCIAVIEGAAHDGDAPVAYSNESN